MAFTQQKKVLEEFEKARNAIKRKYNLIKFQKDNTERVLSETFKPIIDPLEKLIEKKNDNKKLIKQLENDDDEYENKDDETLNFSSINDMTNINESTKSDGDISTSYKELEKTIVDKEELKVPDIEQDRLYGVKASDSGYILGKTPIQFTSDNIIVNDKSYLRTPGLYELIVHKNPLNYTSKDLKIYKDILEVSSVHRKNNNPYGEIKKHKLSKKYIDIIEPLFNLSPVKVTPKQGLKRKSSTPKKSGKGLIPPFKIARQNTHMDYIYWDDPNELVDRLRLLVAEQSAGNLNHTNEIHSIIEELREGEYIY